MHGTCIEINLSRYLFYKRQPSLCTVSGPQRDRLDWWLRDLWHFCTHKAVKVPSDSLCYANKARHV